MLLDSIIAKYANAITLADGRVRDNMRRGLVVGQFEFSTERYNEPHE
jgi:hypothetical protein